VEIAGRVALVTGAGSGIGRASARALAAAGAHVAVADVDDAGGAETVRLIGEAGGTAAFLHADVASASDVGRMVEETERALGPLRIVHNNAGIIRSSAPEAPLEEWLAVVQVNFVGVIICAHAAIRALRRNGGGCIVQTASVAGLVAYPGNPVYAATKAGVVGFTRSLTRLAAENIRVNCICPEVVDTPLVRNLLPLERRNAPGPLRTAAGAPMIPPEQVAAAVLALVRDDSLAGRVMKISPERPPELLEFPTWGIVR
jgi:NAD(P)-dependent dehydrogenase (short-subunit alcohol dehydrogenase family)